MDIQIKPIVTEKANAYSEKLNRYTFAVSPDANKFQIKDIVEKLYNVRVVKVNTADYAGKRKQRWTKSGLLRGKKPAFKKAYVTVAEGQKIDYYSNI
ncbi:MAG: 50S ribosomal protein L23 [Bacteroidales bacterium]|nr:50S ribosomal protein L23 [Bacteroidales bacterium]MBD5218115.1 50S ribosomal protein L23 [Bacteroidales bacterium]MBD5222180.1 50S ribosomal protein L23 [Bacteroidales bacterium]